MKKITKKKIVRKYNNISRADKSARTQQSIIEALVQLLAERRGGDVPLSELAARTKITTRTIFRFFKDKESLHQAMDNYLLSYLQTGAEQMKTLDFIGFAKNAYRLFDRHEALTMAYVLSPFGQEARGIFRKKLNQLMIAKIQHEKKMQPNSKNLKQLALITSLVNAKVWYDIRSDFGFTGEEMESTVEWALKTLLDQMQKEEK